MGAASAMMAISRSTNPPLYWPHAPKHDTRVANSHFFNGEVDQMPKYALTMGVGTLLNAEEVMILVIDHVKAQALQAAVEGNINHMWTISYIQNRWYCVTNPPPWN